ncbi:hypothetical protein Goshw_023585 [Gossypium schwendimanii]|uniref:Uncharacterized protein n=1 Tax=Gossypium schwendimanii TaxID=34291 RepID=A0A7J9MV09_GOSSC|nr:hypothetical protein [Gossypium schwendimanii]
MEALHKLDLWRKTDENWRDYYKEYIDIWDHRMKFLPIREPFFSSNIATYLESRQLHQKRPRRSLQQRRFRGGAATSSSPAPTQQTPSMSMPHCAPYIYISSKYVFRGTSVPIILRPMSMQISTQMLTHVPTPMATLMPPSMPKARTTSYSSTEEGDGGEDEANGGNENECEGQGEEED